VAGGLEGRLASAAPGQSLRSALDVVLAAWRVAGLDSAEDPAVSLESVTHRRGLEVLRLTGNLSMLRLLDLPAVLEVRLPGARESSFVALSAIDDDAAVLTVGSERVRVTPAELDRVWFGDAQVVWRDFEWLGPTFGSEGRGENVVRLQRLLGRAGLYTGAASGTFDAATETAVVGFQRSRRLDPDGRVGRLTRIALYGVAGGYKMPTLSSVERGAS
jgi:general secretion pathway protein A